MHIVENGAKTIVNFYVNTTIKNIAKGIATSSNAFFIMFVKLAPYASYHSTGILSVISPSPLVHTRYFSPSIKTTNEYSENHSPH